VLTAFFGLFFIIGQNDQILVSIGKQYRTPLSSSSSSSAPPPPLAGKGGSMGEFHAV
jgi:hypothetical protein